MERMIAGSKHFAFARGPNLVRWRGGGSMAAMLFLFRAVFGVVAGLFALYSGSNGNILLTSLALELLLMSGLHLAFPRLTCPGNFGPAET